MKKIITIISAMAFCVGIYAKDLNTLVNECKPIIQGKDYLEHRVESEAFVKENKEDILKAFSVWKDTEYAKQIFDSNEWKNASYEQRDNLTLQSKMFARAYDIFHAEMQASDLTLLNLASGAIRFYPDIYQRAKDNNWIYDGYSVNTATIVFMAKIFNDKEYLALNYSVKDVNARAKNLYCELVLDVLTEIEDTAKAKSICREIIVWLVKNYPDSKQLKRANGIKSVLTADMADKALFGK